MDKIAKKHGQAMYILGLQYAIEIVKILGNDALPNLEDKLKQEQAHLDEMEKSKLFLTKWRKNKWHRTN